MAELRTYRISDRKVQTVDARDCVIFTAIYEPHLFHHSITTLYRGGEEAGEVVATFRGGETVVYDGEERMQKQMIYGNENWNKSVSMDMY